MTARLANGLCFTIYLCETQMRAANKNYLFSQLWLPTVQLVLHADWQDVWHSPQPPFFTVFCNFFVLNVLMCFMVCILSIIFYKNCAETHSKNLPLRINGCAQHTLKSLRLIANANIIPHFFSDGK